MNEPLETLYFDWLCTKTSDVTPEEYKDFLSLLWRLHTYEFVWTISGDDNRAEDCFDLRLDFFREENINVDEEFLYGMSHSVFEILIAFSQRASFETDLTVPYWFWTMARNLNLTKFQDEVYSEEAVDEILYKFVWRLYDKKGNGGLFPMLFTRKDQRKIEIWYQFSEYLVENEYI